MSKRGPAGIVVAGVALAVGVMASGCHPKGASGGCSQLGDCGGDPTGVWRIEAPDDICNVPQAVRPAQNYAGSYPQNYEPETTAAPPAQTSGLWCWDLGFTVDPVTKEVMPATPGVPQPIPPDLVVGGPVTDVMTHATTYSTISFNADGTYTYALMATSTTPFHIARACLGVSGKDLSCVALGQKIAAWGFANNPVYTTLPNVTTPAFACNDAGDGCDCAFTYSEYYQTAVGDAGRWAVDKGSNVIHHYSMEGTGNLFSDQSTTRRTVRDATFCVSNGGQTLELSGTNGQPIALKAGLRTIKLTRAPAVPDAGADDAGTPGPQMGVDAGLEAGEPPADADGVEAAGADAAEDSVDGAAATD